MSATSSPGRTPRDEAGPQTTEDRAVRAVVADSERFQNSTDEFVQLFTEDGVIVNLAGRRVKGRSSIYEAMSSALDTPLADVLTTLEVDDVIFVRPDVATVACLKHVHDRREPEPRGDSPAIPEQGRVTFVLV